jgi:protein-serine/threonine kinase
MGKSSSSSQKGKERSAGLDEDSGTGKRDLSSSTSTHTSTSTAIVGDGPTRKPFERSLTGPASYFPPVDGPEAVHDPLPTNFNINTDGNGNGQSNRDLTGLEALRNGRKDSFPTTTTTTSTSLSNSNSIESSGEQVRKYSHSATVVTDRSSHSSSSQINGHLAGPSQSHSSSGARSPGSAFGGFKARFFSNPAKAASRDKSPTRIDGSKQDRYKGIGIGVTTGSGTRDQSIGSSSLSPSEVSPSKKSGTIPSTPNRKHLQPPPSPLPLDDKETPSKGSAATRWLRRVVSAPNTKALLSQSQSQSTNDDSIPPVPPVPSSAIPSSPVIVITSQEKPLESPTTGLGLDDGMESPTKQSRSTPSPHKPPITSSLNPNPIGVRGQRAATISSGAKAKDIQAQLGLGVAGESHHKQVFRRTYSSNSIKTRSVR